MDYERNPGVEEDTQQGRYLTFSVGGEIYGLEIAAVREIVGIQPITPLPDSSGAVKGIINLRGRIISVTDARLRFGMAPAEYTDNTCIIIVDSQSGQAGLIVDNVCEVLTIDDENIVAPPQLSSGGPGVLKAIGKVGNEVKLLLETKRLFDDNGPKTAANQ